MSGRGRRQPAPHGGPARSPERLGAVLAAIIAVWALVGAYAVHTNMPTNAIKLPLQTGLKRDVQRILPQAWAFFTKSPRDDAYVPYLPSGGGAWASAEVWPHAEPRNAFGFNRRSRAQGVEVGLLQGDLTEAAWKDCTGHPTGCFEALEPVPARNRSPEPTLCGTVGIAREVEVPWAWARRGSATVMPSKVVKLDVTCER